MVRRQRRSDGTVSLNGARLEIPSRYQHLEHVHLHYARWDLSRVDMVDHRAGSILYAVKPLDKSANANGQRRRLSPSAIDLLPLTPKGLSALVSQLLADHAATGVPRAYLSIMPTPTTPCTTGEALS